LTLYVNADTVIRKSKPSATGRPHEWPMREIVNGIFYVTRAGSPWRLLPNDLSPWGTIYRWFAAWSGQERASAILLERPMPAQFG
jgi:transposase